MSEVLAKELETYAARKAELVARAPGKFVLIKGDQVAGFFDTEMDAVRQGYKEFGNVPFLVKKIEEVEGF